MEPASSVPTTHIAKELLSKAHSPSAADTIFKEKVLQRSLFLRPTSPDPSSRDARAQRRLQRLRKAEQKKRRQKPKPLSAKEKRISGIYDIPKEQQKHALYVPLHKMWVGYMREVLGIEGSKKPYITAKGAGSHLASADYHGAELAVVRSRCVGIVGLKGIVIKDTKFTFQIITEKNILKSISAVSNRPEYMLMNFQQYLRSILYSISRYHNPHQPLRSNRRNPKLMRHSKGLGHHRCDSSSMVRNSSIELPTGQRRSSNRDTGQICNAIEQIIQR